MQHHKEACQYTAFLAVAYLKENNCIVNPLFFIIHRAHMSPRQRDVVRFRVLQAIEQNPKASQRELAKALGVSLGSVNFCLKELVDKGLVKIENFVKSDHKKGYAYYLTPTGLVEKTGITAQFLKHKLAEYELLKQEIKELKSQV